MPKRKLPPAEDAAVGNKTNFEPRLTRSAAKKRAQAADVAVVEESSKTETATTAATTVKESNHIKCPCGYDPRQSNQPLADIFKKGCSSTRAFINHIIYPSFKIIRDMSRPTASAPKHHWSLLVEIKTVDNGQKFECIGETYFGEEIKIKFKNTNKPTTFDWSMLKKGHILAILYAQANSDHIEVTDLGNCYIFPAPFESLINEGYSVLDQADYKHRKWSPLCLTCDSSTEPGFLQENTSCVCNKCKTATFCRKSCEQNAHAQKFHLLCAHLNALLSLSLLPRYEFKGERFSFKPSQQPKYIFTEKCLQIPWVIPNDMAKNRCGYCGRTTRECLLEKRSLLTQTDCCKNWICDDEDSYHTRRFIKPCRQETSCYRDHWKYSLCYYHHTNRHKGESYKKCKRCKEEFDPADFAEASYYDMKCVPKGKKTTTTNGNKK